MAENTRKPQAQDQGRKDRQDPQGPGQPRQTQSGQGQRGGQDRQVQQGQGEEPMKQRPQGEQNGQDPQQDRQRMGQQGGQGAAKRDDNEPDQLRDISKGVTDEEDLETHRVTQRTPQQGNGAKQPKR